MSLCRGAGLLAAALILLALAGGGNGQSPPAGKELFAKRCGGCHALDREKEGPRLGGVYGRPSASVPSFDYSPALKQARIEWNMDSLDRWLTDPDQFAPGTDMAFRLDKLGERRAIIDYLRGLSGK